MEKPASIYEIIRKKTLEHLARTEPNFGEWQTFYLPVLGRSLGTQEEGQDLLNVLEAALNDSAVGSCLITGASGMGKTSFTRQWVKRFYERVQSQRNEKPLIMLWIPLLSISNPKQRLLSEHLREHLGLDEKRIQEFLRNHPMRLIVCCDGYDELNTQANLYPVNEIGLQVEVKMVYTCRPEVINRDKDYSKFFAKRDKQLLEYELVPFKAEQREKFIAEYIKHNRKHLESGAENLVSASSSTSSSQGFMDVLEGGQASAQRQSGQLSWRGSVSGRQIPVPQPVANGQSSVAQSVMNRNRASTLSSQNLANAGNNQTSVHRQPDQPNSRSSVFGRPLPVTQPAATDRSQIVQTQPVVNRNQASIPSSQNLANAGSSQVPVQRQPDQASLRNSVLSRPLPPHLATVQPQASQAQPVINRNRASTISSQNLANAGNNQVPVQRQPDQTSSRNTVLSRPLPPHLATVQPQASQAQSVVNRNRASTSSSQNLANAENSQTSVQNQLGQPNSRGSGFSRPLPVPRPAATGQFPVLQSAVNQIQPATPSINNQKVMALDWTKVETYTTYFRRMLDLEEIIGNPFLLFMTLQALPQIVKQEGEKNQQEIVLTRHKIYSAFMDRWWDWQIKKLEHRKQLPELEKALEAQQKDKVATQANEQTDTVWIKKQLNRFAQKLALGMFQRKVNEITLNEAQHAQKKVWSFASISPASKEKDERWLERYFGDDSSLALIRSCLPLIWVGQRNLAFIHKSLLEFFAAEQLFMSAVVNIWAETGKNLDAICLVNSNETETLKLLIERVQNSEAFEKTLWEIVELSKSEPRIWRAAANAMTLLNAAGKNFISKDLRGVHIGGEDEQTGERWGADLSGALLDSADFSDADLRYVRFDHSWLNRAKLTRSIMHGVEFGELPWLKGERVCYSPITSLLAVATEKKIVIYDGYTYEKIRSFNHQHKAKVKSLVFSPSGQQLVSSSQEKTIYVWNIQSGRCDFQLDACETSEGGHWLSYSPDGEQLASVNSKSYINHKIFLWNLKSGKCETILKYDKKYDAADFVTYSPNGKQLVSAGGKAILFWDVASGKCERVLERSDCSIGSITYSPTGKYLAWAESKTIYLWDTENNRVEHCFQTADKYYVKSLSYTEDGRILVSAGADGIIRLWDMQDKQLICRLLGNKATVKNLFYLSGKKQLVSCGKDKTIRFWNIDGHYINQTLNESFGQTYDDIQLSSDGNQLAMSLGNETISVFDIETGKFARLSRLPKEPGLKPRKVAFHPRNIQFAFSVDTSVNLWNIENGKLEAVLKNTTSPEYLTYSPDGKQLAVVGKDRIIRLWNTVTASCEYKLEGHTNTIFSIAYRADGNELASCGLTNNDDDIYSSAGDGIRLWDAATGKIKKILKIASKYQSFMYPLLYRSDGNQLAFGIYYENTIQLWNTVTASCEYKLKGHTDHIVSIVYSLDGTALASASEDKTIRIWSLLTGKCTKVLEGHQDCAHSVIYSSDGLYLASASSDDTVRLWDVNSGTCLVTIPSGDSVSILKLKYSQKFQGYFLFAFCSDDGSIRKWEIKKTGSTMSFQLMMWSNSNSRIRSLQSYEVDVQGVMGLQKQQYRLLQQRGGDTVKGKPSSADPAKVAELIQQRNMQKFVPSGEIEVQSQNGDFKITRQNWLISMVRINPNATKNNSGSSSSSNQSKSDSSSSESHVYLILQGLDERYYTVIKEFHLRLNVKESAVTFFNTVGKAVIQIHDRSPWDLKLIEENLLARSWVISKTAAEALIARIEKQQQSKMPSYSISGKVGDNCVSWCLKQLKDADIPVDTNLNWYRFICVLPSDYLPEPQKESEENEREKCLVM